MEAVEEGKVKAEDLIAEIIRCLLILKVEREKELQGLLSQIEEKESIPLSAEAIITLIEQHLKCPKSSRLPVLTVAACYKAAQDKLGERVLPLEKHTAADEQTGALGDVSIALLTDDKVITAYEMKDKRIEQTDIDRALTKAITAEYHIDNYILISTEPIDPVLKSYADSLYEQTGGIEFALLDCLSFLRYFLHLFHRLRLEVLEEYQELVLNESESGVSHELKKAFLALRQAAELPVDSVI